MFFLVIYLDLNISVEVWVLLYGVFFVIFRFFIYYVREEENSDISDLVNI